MSSVYVFLVCAVLALFCLPPCLSFSLSLCVCVLRCKWSVCFLGHLVAVVTPQGGTLVDSSPDLAITSSDTAFSTALLDTPSVVVPASLESKPQASSTPLVAASGEV